MRTMLRKDVLRKGFDSSPVVGYAVEKAICTREAPADVPAHAAWQYTRWQSELLGDDEHVFVYSKDEAIAARKQIEGEWRKGVQYSVCDLRSVKMTDDEYEDYLVDMAVDADFRRYE